MRNTVINIVAVIALVGCGNLDTGDSTYMSSEYTYTENNIDYGSGTVLQCDDSTCSVLTDDHGRTVRKGDKNSDAGDAIVGEYDPSYTPAECRAAGFFYCTVSDSCTNQRVDDASSSCGK